MRPLHLVAVLSLALLAIAAAASAKIDSGNMNAGASFDHTFDKTGTWGYVCLYHPGMEGTVTIEKGAATEPVTVGMGLQGEAYVFMPSAITIGPGTAVTWNNNDTVPHTVTETAADFDEPAKEGSAVGFVALLVVGLALIAARRRA